MLPISLRLRNFLSYGDDAPTLHLEEVHLACLCGANGHGKSAILDGITWALWGIARAQRNDQLIHQGKQEMSVELAFDVKDRRYQVVRRLSRARKAGLSSLELSVFTGSEYRPITGNTMSQTQEQIKDLINMDYETFVNSAFLVQGRADIFSMATPAQRKVVLGKVLGLGIYERLEDRAKRHARDAQVRLDDLGSAGDQIRSKVDRKGEVEGMVIQTQTELIDLQETATLLEQRLTSLHSRISQLEAVERGITELDYQVASVSLRLSSAKNDGSELERRIASWEPTIAESKEIEAGFETYRSELERLALLNSAAQELLALERELSPLEQRITAGRVALEGKISGHQERLTHELIPLSDSLSESSKGIDILDQRIAELKEREDSNSALIVRRQNILRDVDRIEAQKVILKAEGEDTSRKLEMLEHHHLEESLCPLCGIEIGEEAKIRIRASYQEKIDEQRNQWTAQSARAKAMDSESAKLASQVQSEENAISAQRAVLERHRADLNVQIDQGKSALIERERIEQELLDLRAALQNQQFAVREQTEAASVRAQILDLGFDPSGLEIAKQKVEALQKWEEKHIRLEEILRRLPDDRAALTSAKTRQEEATAELMALNQRRLLLQGETNELGPYRAQLKDLDEQRTEIVTKRDSLQSEMGSLAHQLSEISRAEDELEQLRITSSALAREVSIYEELVVAFGKNGVPSLVIEANVPFLEDQSNELLKRMTDGRMSLKLETQREKKKARSSEAEAAETLEITVGDELGTRSYDMFSGGERFRVDFALRIALSKLLARRAGAPLPTLFIDEGFGTQDVQGRDRILEVLKAIEGEFQRVLVITHMDEVKEAFPVRIEVTRTLEGSTFSLS